MDWLIAFLNKTPAELSIGEAGIMILLICAAGIGICVMLLKASGPAPNVMRFPEAPSGTVNPFLKRLDPGKEKKLPEVV